MMKSKSPGPMDSTREQLPGGKANQRVELLQGTGESLPSSVPEKS